MCGYEDSWDSNMSVLVLLWGCDCSAANMMMGHNVLFDVEEGAIGFTESHYDYRRLVEDVAEEEDYGVI